MSAEAYVPYARGLSVTSGEEELILRPARPAAQATRVLQWLIELWAEDDPEVDVSRLEAEVQYAAAKIDDLIPRRRA